MNSLKDDLWFATYRVREAIEYFVAHGFTHVFIDEVHHLGKDWSLLIKNVFDQFPSLFLIYSGSSLLQIENARGLAGACSAERRDILFQSDPCAPRGSFSGIGDFLVEGR